MRKTVLLFLFVMISVGLVGCEPKEKPLGQTNSSEPVYEVKIPDKVTGATLIDEFQKTASQFFKGSYPDMVYAEFYYEGNLAQIDQAFGDMQLHYLGIPSDGLVKTPVKLSAIYTKSDRHIAYYVENTTDKSDLVSQKISSQRFILFVDKMKEYLQNIGLNEGYVELSELPLEGYWIVYHYPAEGKNADLELKIKSDTLEIMDYKQNP